MENITEQRSVCAQTNRTCDMVEVDSPLDLSGIVCTLLMDSQFQAVFYISGKYKMYITSKSLEIIAVN